MEGIKKFLVGWFLALVIAGCMVAAFLLASGFFDGGDGWWRDDWDDDNDRPPPGPKPEKKRDIERMVEEIIQKTQRKLKELNLK